MMIDILIPVYNNYQNLRYTLCSISMQTIKDILTVYIIDNCSTILYKNIIEEFKSDLNIKYLTAPNHLNNGALKQFALDNSNGNYIFFLTPNELLNNPRSLNDLYIQVDNGNDYIHSICYNSKFNTYDDNEHNLKAKLYSRNFIYKNNIKFNNLDYFEDFYFNTIIKLSSPKEYYFNMPTCTHTQESFDITNIEYFNNPQNFLKLDFFIKSLKEILNFANTNNIENAPIINQILKNLSNIYFSQDDIRKALFKEWFFKYNLKIIFNNRILNDIN